jgi:hypothetical protein
LKNPSNQTSADKVSPLQPLRPFYVEGIKGDVKMTANDEKRVPWFLWPFWAIWQLVAWIVGLTGRLVAVVLGLVLMIAGVVISLTVIGAIIGIPFFLVGLLLVFRGLF